VLVGETERQRSYAQTELRRGLVLPKLVLPFRVRERREDARDGPPLGDAQPGLGESRDASDDDDRDDEGGGEQEPVAHCRWGEHRELLLLLLLLLTMRAAIAVGGKETRRPLLLPEHGLGRGRQGWP
jgi:hypothetical protein